MHLFNMRQEGEAPRRALPLYTFDYSALERRMAEGPVRELNALNYLAQSEIGQHVNLKDLAEKHLEPGQELRPMGLGPLADCFEVFPKEESK